LQSATSIITEVIQILPADIDSMLVNTGAMSVEKSSVRGKSALVFRLTVPVRGKTASVFRLRASLRGKRRAVFRLSTSVSADSILK
jgi:hypothetical protein